MEERRQYVRLPVEMEFSYAVESDPWGQIARTENVSAGGLRASVQKPVNPGTRCSVQLTLPDRQPIPVTAEAVWSGQFLYTTTDKKSGFKVGLRFVRINAQDRQRLKEYVSGTVR